MEAKSSAQKLQCLLINHNKVRKQIKLLERLIQRHHRQAVRSIHLGQKGQALHYMGCKTVVQSVKYFYQQYSTRSWIRVQTMAREIMLTLDPRSVPPPLVIPEEDFHCLEEQTLKYQHALAVAHCNFSRTS
ncbi:uncharacterized protein LOC134234062 [Saccostrea cucullata]|uniref:uncharacterized protein LOC134234062 n=1 Tax=Saccostrea cuccullata TaxID=36930 RepID=UPI002ED39A03